jgi:hypothetical protein
MEAGFVMVNFSGGVAIELGDQCAVAAILERQLNSIAYGHGESVVAEHVRHHARPFIEINQSDYIRNSGRKRRSRSASDDGETVDASAT